MNRVKLQDIKSTHRNPLHSCTLTMRKQKEKLRKQFHSPLQQYSAWWTMEWGSWNCIGDRDQENPHGKEMQKSIMAVWGGLTNSCEKKRSKRKKERYTHLNAAFQRIARRDKKAFLSDQCKEIEEKTEWERLGICSRKSEILKEDFLQRWAR